MTRRYILRSIAIVLSILVTFFAKGTAITSRLKAESRNINKPAFIPLKYKAGRWQGQTRLPFTEDWKITVVTGSNDTPISRPLYRNTKKTLTYTLKQDTRMFPGVWRSEEQQKIIRNNLNCPEKTHIGFHGQKKGKQFKIQIPASLKNKNIHAVLLTDRLQFVWQLFGVTNAAELEVPEGISKDGGKYQVIIVECK